MVLTAQQLSAWLRSWHPLGEDSVDRIIEGDGATTVRGIAVMWYPTWATLRSVVERGHNVVVTHEPTYFNHYDLRGFDETFAHLPPRALHALQETRDAKRRWIHEQGLVVIRCHDALDSMPGGIVDSLATELGFSLQDYITQVPHHRVVRIEPPVTAREVAGRLARAFGRIGQPGVAFYGDPKRVVHSLGLGTGYGCDPWRFVELGAQMAVTINDRVKTWTELAWADDSGYPLVVIDHGTSEEWGQHTMAKLIAARYADLPVELIEQGCSFRWIPA